MNDLDDPNSLETRFARLHSAARREPNPPVELRARRLRALDRLLRDNADALAEAVCQDFGNRSLAETRLLELFPCHAALADALKHLRRWMRPQRRRVSTWFRPARAEVRFQPLGAVGIIVPWNYPIFLAVAPLAGALAAGNRVLTKMSELTPATSRLFARLIARHFSDDEVSVVEGDAQIAQAFAQLPFDHLLFTGSTPVGRHVMRAAAENLVPVTLELGGKSPAIIGNSANFAKAVERIIVGKTLNAGQTCIAPDYVLLPAGREQDFIEIARRVVARCYPDILNTPDYTSIINDRHYVRLCGYVDEAREQGAEIVELVPGALSDPLSRRLFPLVLHGVNDGMCVMQDEIFGPLLPLVPYRNLDQAIDYVNARPRPLALYFFETDSSSLDRVLKQTVSGGVTINDTILHIAQDDLPFGGVGPSGMGCYHGFDGFRTFSAQKGVFHQSRFSGIGLFKPPYGARFERLMKILLH
ncbi:MAG: coniferyl aldehyde dehydrogenase [Propionivibrio sp.]|nr:coniferyl aldehyde dehydrogenase [Propionivibrio sp.]